MRHDPVIIVGAGPVGLTVAEILTQQGIAVIVLEKQATPSPEWRASTFHAATLELLEPTGVSEELVARGLIADKIQYRDRQTGLYAEFDMTLLKNDTKYPFRLQCPQSTYVQILANRLQKRSPGSLWFNAELVGLEQDNDGVQVTVQTAEGIKTLQTPFLLGTDGGKSMVRKLLGIAFEGMTYEERFLLVGTPVPFDQFLPDIAYVNYVSDIQEFLFILRVPEAWRLLYPVPSTISDEQALSEQSIQATLQKALHADQHFPIVERMIYRVHQRVAEKFHIGHVVLLGDAAHVNSPLGGLGLNSGIHDAADLSIRLVRLLNAHTSTETEAELQAYSHFRRQVAVAYVQEMSERNTRLLKEQDPQQRVRMQQALAREAADPERARLWLLRSSLLTSIREQKIGVMPA